MARYSLFVLKVPLNTSQPTMTAAGYHRWNIARHLQYGDV